MLETALQKDVIDAVREAGGEASKLSNRFLIGVSDLLVKFPDLPAMLVEVKKDVYPVATDRVKIDLTPKQLQFLRGFDRAGMTCGVLSFLYDRRKGKRLMHGAVFGVEQVGSVPFTAPLSAYRKLDQARQFGSSVVRLLRLLD